MKLYDNDGGWLRFLKTRNTDGSRFATRTGTRSAVLNSLKGNVGDYAAEEKQPNQVAVNRPDGCYTSYNATIEYGHGLLSIGCHTFDRKNSKKILHWLSITPTQFATARKIGKKVNG